jgi:hypothetical protein
MGTHNLAHNCKNKKTIFHTKRISLKEMSLSLLTIFMDGT